MDHARWNLCLQLCTKQNQNLPLLASFFCRWLPHCISRHRPNQAQLAYLLDLGKEISASRRRAPCKYLTYPGCSTIAHLLRLEHLFADIRAAISAALHPAANRSGDASRHAVPCKCAGGFSHSETRRHPPPQGKPVSSSSLPRAAPASISL